MDLPTRFGWISDTAGLCFTDSSGIDLYELGVIIALVLDLIIDVCIQLLNLSYEVNAKRRL